MTGVDAAGLWIGLHVLLLFVLKMLVGRARTSHKIGFGDGKVEAVQRAIRVQGNAVEDVPIALIGLGGLAFLGAPVPFIHAVGGTLFLGRVLHAQGLSGSTGTSFGRFAGTLISIICLLVIGVACIVFAF